MRKSYLLFRERLRSLLLVALFVVGVCAPTGCGNPCNTLADETCELVGAKAKECTDARKRAAGAGTTERDICRRALKLLEAAVPE